MCGICGVVSAGRPAETEAVARMAAQLDHRGPDGDGAWDEPGVALGFRRLAILDLSEAGMQPMAGADGRHVLVHNGEIYNYRELRAELEAKGHPFRTGTDTEVVLAAYREWGERCVERVGKPSARQREIYTAVYASLQAGIECMRPGKSNVDAAKAIHAAAAEYGLSDHFLSLFIGHGVGIGSNEPPYIGETLPGEEYEFEPGMVFALEPLIWVEGVRGGGEVRLEEMILVTDSEAHVMSRGSFCDDLLI